MAETKLNEEQIYGLNTDLNSITTELGTKESSSNKSNSYTESSTTTYASTKALVDGLATKQNTLVSGTSIKTINNESILGSGNIETKTINSSSIIGNGNFSLADTSLSNVSNNIDYVVESGGTSSNWYRLWKSGWVEQGGKTSSGAWTQIQLTKEYEDANYTITATGSDPDMDTALCTCQVTSVTSSSFYIGNYYNGSAFGYCMWYACGFIKTETEGE